VLSPSAGRVTKNCDVQDFDLTAPIVDFFVADGSRLDHAETSGAAKITIAKIMWIVPCAV